MDGKRKAMVFGCIAAATLIFFYHTRLRQKWRKRTTDSKPQRNFKLILADNSYRPFVHVRPPQMTEDQHPFHKDINALLEGFKDSPEVTELTEGPPPMTKDCVWIDTKDGLELAVEILSKETEFAVDTEQHSIRSFHGFTALLQMSTRKQDFLIDAIALHDEMNLLKKVFSDPNICKVFHGADSDILWLQRDFHIYVVNLFDTAKACDILGKRSRSLAFLLEHYCGVVTNKIFQLADWRLRPLPEEMLLYARIDAHYLLYISDCLKKELLHGENMGRESRCALYMYTECARRSNLMCLQLYEKDSTLPTATASSMVLRCCNDSRKIFKNAEEICDSRVQKELIALCEWRDNIARFADESPRYVLSDQGILAIVERHPLSTKALLECLAEGDAARVLNEAPYMTHVPSPSPVLLENIDSLMDVLNAVEQTTSQDCMDFEYSVDSGDQIRRQIQQHGHRNKKSRDYEMYRKKFVERFSCKGPVYENCRIYASDGGLLCFCDRKKLDWYVKRGLAEFLDEDPPAIRILFEPKRRPQDEKNDFYLQSKINRCVGCGETSHYLRYRVVPSCYRQYYPQHLKSHRSHDIVLLCVDCHVIANSAAEKHKKQVASRFGVPLFEQRTGDSGMVVRNESDNQISDASRGGFSLRSVGFAAVALLRYGSKIPEERRKELEAVVQSYYGGRSIDQQDLTEAAFLGRRQRNSNHHQKRKGLAADKVYTPTKDTGDYGASLYCNGNATGKLDGIEFGDADVSSRSGNSDICEDPCVIILNNVRESGSVEISSKLEQCNGVDIDGTDTQAEESSERQQQRVSMLGHTFHGKKVVQMLLESEGEEGITKFCQMWRSVFVEAVKPMYLPAGWNILHSDYREFGEHSIYNPGKEQQLDFNGEDK